MHLLAAVGHVATNCAASSHQGDREDLDLEKEELEIDSPIEAPTLCQHRPSLKQKQSPQT